MIRSSRLAVASSVRWKARCGITKLVAGTLFVHGSSIETDPIFKKSSPLDEIHLDTWQAGWTTEFIDLPTVLDRLVKLEEEQADLLRRILDGPLYSRADLTESGTKWPAGPKDRKVRYPIDIEAGGTNARSPLGRATTGCDL